MPSRRFQDNILSLSGSNDAKLNFPEPSAVSMPEFATSSPSDPRQTRESASSGRPDSSIPSSTPQQLAAAEQTTSSVDGFPKNRTEDSFLPEKQPSSVSQHINQQKTSDPTVKQGLFGNQEGTGPLPQNDNSKGSNTTSEQEVSHLAPEHPFRILDRVRHKKNFLGIPSVTPPLKAADLFNPWAFLFGPLYFLFRGLWRKGLLLLLIWFLCHIPSTSSELVPLQQALIEEYAIAHLFLTVLSILFTLLFCMGKHLASAITALLFSIIFVEGHTSLPLLDMGDFSAFVWLNAGLVWTALVRIILFSLFGKNLFFAVITVCFAIFFYFQGLPVTITLADIPAIAFPLLCGMMGTYDLYRAKRLGQKFWW